MPKLLGDGRRFKQILMNLVKNAIKFTEEGSIDICVKYTGLWLQRGKLEIDVKDTGHGIESQDMPLLFTLFGKLQRTSEMNSNGIGLGLSIVKQIVDNYNGEVSVYSAGVGKGSTFSVTLMIESIIAQ